MEIIHVILPAEAIGHRTICASIISHPLFFLQFYFNQQGKVILTCVMKI